MKHYGPLSLYAMLCKPDQKRSKESEAVSAVYGLSSSPIGQMGWAFCPCKIHFPYLSVPTLILYSGMKELVGALHIVHILLPTCRLNEPPSPYVTHQHTSERKLNL